MDKIGVRIKSTGGTLMGAEITDLASGLPITGVTHVSIDMPIDAPCLATLTVLASVEFEGPGEIFPKWIIGQKFRRKGFDAPYVISNIVETTEGPDDTLITLSNGMRTISVSQKELVEALERGDVWEQSPKGS